MIHLVKCCACDDLNGLQCSDCSVIEEGLDHLTDDEIAFITRVRPPSTTLEILLDAYDPIRHRHPLYLDDMPIGTEFGAW